MVGQVINEGTQLCTNMKSSNKGDYLTNKVANEVEDIVNELESLDNKVKSVESKVQVERNRLAEIERRKQKEKEEAKENT